MLCADELSAQRMKEPENEDFDAHTLQQSLEEVESLLALEPGCMKPFAAIVLALQLSSCVPICPYLSAQGIKQPASVPEEALDAHTLQQSLEEVESLLELDPADAEALQLREELRTALQLLNPGACCRTRPPGRWLA